MIHELELLLKDNKVTEAQKIGAYARSRIVSLVKQIELEIYSLCDYVDSKLTQN